MSSKLHGKWSESGVPHQGWRCVGSDDLGSPIAVCEMCEWQEIRYVHYMAHDDYADTLRVGCECAAKMEGDYIAAKAAAKSRESWWKARAKKRQKWLTRPWRSTKQGNPTIKSDGYRIVVHRKAGGWSCTVYKDETYRKVEFDKIYPAMDEAKLAVFDAVTRRLIKMRRHSE